MAIGVSIMVEYSSVLLALEASIKRRIERAASARGQSLTTFILGAAQAEAERVAAGRMAPPTAGGFASHVSEAEWLREVDRLVEGLELAAGEVAPPGPAVAGNAGARPKPRSVRDARRSRRRAVTDLALLNPVFGKVVDMSTSGLGIEASQSFTVAERNTFSIGGGMYSAKIKAEVRWCKLVRTDSLPNGDVIAVYRSGLAFLGSCAT